jgi:exocyst complex component 2
MALDIVKLYISQISDFFKLSDVAIMTAPGASLVQPPHLPLNSHSICTAYYLNKILGDIHDTVNDLNSLDIAKDSGLKGLLENARWRFVDFLVKAWLRGLSFTLSMKWLFNVSRRQHVPLRGSLGIEPK